jgi:hypothetical protein
MLIEKLSIFLVNTLLLFCSHKHSFTPYPSLSPYSQMGRITDRETNTLAAHGLEELFSSCAVVSVFWLWQEIILGVITYHTSCGVVLFIWLQQEIVLGCTDQYLVVVGNSIRCYLLLIYHTSCDIVSVFLVAAGNSIWLHSF